MNKGVSIIVFYDECTEIQVTHNCTRADHDKLIEDAPLCPFNDKFSEYPYVSYEQLRDDMSASHIDSNWDEAAQSQALNDAFGDHGQG